MRYLTILFCALALAAETTGAYAADLKVIARANRDHADRAPFIKKNLVQIFTLRARYWPSGEPVRIFILSRDSLYTQLFVREYLGMSPQLYFDILNSGQASGRNSTPQELETAAELVYKVLSTPGAIGYADESLLINSNGRLVILGHPALPMLR